MRQGEFLHGQAPRTTRMTCDANGRLLTERVAVGAGPGERVTTYTYDDANNRETKTQDTDGDGTVDESWTYTTHYGAAGWNQLAGFTRSALVADGGGTPALQAVEQVSYTYDEVGNRATRTRAWLSAEAGNAATAAPWQRPGTTAYHWDADNRLLGVDEVEPSPGGGGAVRTYAYAYDHRTRRLLRDESQGVGGQVGRIVFSGGTSVQEYEDDPAGNPPESVLVTEHIRGSDYGGGVGGMLYSVRDGAPSYAHSNARGDVVGRTDAAGNFTWQASYEAFGTRLSETGSTPERQRANTKDEDPTGLLNEGFRYRDLETGTFISRDPAGFVDGPNLYCYANQNPWTKFDPLGLEERKSKLGVPASTSGQHVVPFESWDKLPVSKEVQVEFNKRTIPTRNHGWSRAHDTYNRLVTEESEAFINNYWKGKPPALINSAKEAQEFTDALTKHLESKGNPFIKEFNDIYRKSGMDATLDRTSMTKKVNQLLDDMALEGKIPEMHLSLPSLRVLQKSKALMGFFSIGKKVLPGAARTVSRISDANSAVTIVEDMASGNSRGGLEEVVSTFNPEASMIIPFVNMIGPNQQTALERGNAWSQNPINTIRMVPPECRGCHLTNPYMPR